MTTNQGNLFALDAYGEAHPRHLARKNDPQESQQAAQRIAKKIGEDQRYAIECVTKSPGLTAGELENKYGDPKRPGKIWKRLHECEKRGLIKRGPSRVCSITGNVRATWNANGNQNETKA